MWEPDVNDPSKPLVLLAQSDEEDLFKLSVASKKYNKYYFKLATSGREILNQIEKYNFNAIVLGLRFYDITGTTVVSLINNYDPNIFIIFLTSYRESLLPSMNLPNYIILDKKTEMSSIETLCQKIYEASIGNFVPLYECDDMDQKEHKLFVPDSVSKLMQRRT